MSPATPAESAPAWTGATGSPTRILLARHGQTALSVDRRYSGRGNPPLTETGLRQRKVATLDAAVLALESARGRSKVTLDIEQARALTVALTDVRLVLGARLGLERDEDHDALVARAQEGQLDPTTEHGVHLYDFLTWLQETLAESLAQRWERRAGR